MSQQAVIFNANRLLTLSKDMMLELSFFGDFDGSAKFQDTLMFWSNVSEAMEVKIHNYYTNK